MSSNQPKAGGNACILCFWSKRACVAGSRPCRSRTALHQSPCIAEDILGPGIIAKLRGWSEGQQNELAFVTQSHHMLECQPTSGLEIGGLYTFTLGGAFNISNQDFVAQLDRMVLDTFAPKIQAKDGDPKSISLACLGIGYCNMLIFANLQDNSEPPFDRHELSPIFAELAIMRINGLVSDTMNLVRNDQHGLGADSRPFLDLWFLYLSAMPKLGRLQLFDNEELLEHVQKNLALFRKELRTWLASDCEKKVDWADAFEDSQRSLVRKLRGMKSWTLSVKWVSWPMPPSGPVHYGPPQVHQASNLPQGTPSIDHVVDSRLNESLTTTSVTSNWTGLGSNMLPMAITGLTYDVQPTLSASTNETPNLDSNQSIDFDTDIDPFANQDYFTPRDSQQDYLGDYTFSWH